LLLLLLLLSFPLLPQVCWHILTKLAYYRELTLRIPYSTLIVIFTCALLLLLKL
jgi:hypothetical protein